MNRIFCSTLIIIIVLLLSSCEKKVAEHNTRWDGEKTYQIGEDIPFTGIIEKKNSEGRIIKQTKVKNGEDTEIIEYYKDGNIKYRKEGNADKQFYSPDGRAISRDEYLDNYRNYKK